MRKIFSCIVALMAFVALNAKEIVVDFTSKANWESWGIALPNAGEGTDLNGKSITVDGVTFTFTKGTNKTTVRLFQGSGNNEGKYDLRLYKEDVMALSVSGEDKINLVNCGVAIPLKGTTEALAEFVSVEGVQLVEFQATGSTTIRSITVKVNEDVAVWTPDTLTVSEARKLIAANDPLCKKTHYIKGVASSDNFGKTWPGWAMIWMRDIVNVTDSLEGYKITNTAERKNFASAEEVGIMVGDTVLLFADGLTKYNDIFETTSGYLVEVKGSSAVTRLDITQGVARYNADESELELSLTTEQGDFVITIVDYYNAKAIVGEYSFNEETGVTLAGEALTLTNGKMTIAYNKGYTVNVTLNTADKAYVLTGEKLVLGEFPDDIPYEPEPLPEGVLTCDSIYNIGIALADNATTEVEYRLRGWVITTFEPKADKNGVMQQSAYLADERTAKSGNVQAYYCYFNEQVAKGDYVEVAGKVTKYVDGSKLVIEIKNGQMTKLNTTEGFFNATESVKAVKRVINGQLFIERAGVLYTITGAAL